MKYNERMSTHLSIIIPTHNRPQLLRRTLDSLYDCTKPAGYFETIVVENGTRTGAEQVVTNCPSSLNARYIYVERANKSHALNEALKTVNEGLIFFTDDDVRFEKSTLQAYVHAAQGKQGGVFYGGPTRADYEHIPEPWLVPFLPASASNEKSIDGQTDRPPYLFLGFNWAAFKCDVVATGGFDTMYGPGSPVGAGGQESDMQQRLLENDIEQVYLADALVWHYVPEERCTARWVLQRKYRTGLAKGLRAKNDSSRPDLRHAMQCLKSVATDAGRCFMYSVSLDKQRSFEMLMRCVRNIGRLRGYYLINQ